MLSPTILSATSITRTTADILACPQAVIGLAPRPPLADVARVLLSLLAVFNDDEDCKIFVNYLPFKVYY